MAGGAITGQPSGGAAVILPVKGSYYLSADQSALGPAIADYFPAPASFSYEAGGVYIVDYALWYLKGAANGTVTFTLTSTSVPANVAARIEQSAASGIGSSSGGGIAGVVGQTGTAIALPASASLSFGANHQTLIRVVYEANASTPGDLRLRVTNSSTGTVTPQRGSYYLVRKLPSGNYGAFVA